MSLKQLQRSLLANWPAKVLSIVAAIALWLGVAAAEQRAGTFPGGIPVSFENVPQGLVAIADTAEVSISVVADQALWSRFNVDSFRASVDLRGATVGVSDRPVIVTSRIPGVEITGVNPRSILVRLEPLAVKEVSVQIRLEGQPADGFAPGEIVTEPSVVQISGPESILSQIDQVVGTVALNGERDAIEQRVTLRAIVAGQEAESVNVTPGEVLARVPIERAGNVKTVGVLVSTTGSLPSGYAVADIQAQPSVVTLTGSPVALAAVSSVRTQEVDLSEMTAPTEVQVPLIVPEGVRLAESGAGTVRVILDVQELTTRRTFEVPIVITDIPNNRSVVSRDPETVEITLEGPLSELGTLSEQAVRLEIPLPKGLPVGTHTLEIFDEHVVRPAGVSVLGIVPDAVIIELDDAGQ